MAARQKTVRPVRHPLQRIYPEVFFDLETTGLSHHSHITQISAVRSDGEAFNRFVRTEIPIPRKVSNLTGITCVNKQMYSRGQPVESVSLTVGLNAFCEFLGDDPCVLVAHNAIFDAKVLFQAATCSGRADEIKSRVGGFLDTLRLFKKEFPGLSCKYNQPALVQHFLHESYDAHNAVHDTEMLKRLLEHCQFDWITKQPNTFNWDFVEETVALLNQS